MFISDTAVTLQYSSCPAAWAKDYFRIWLKENVEKKNWEMLISISQSPKWHLKNVFFFSATDSLKTKVSSFTIINDKEKQQILAFKKLQPDIFAWKMA